MYKKLPSIAIGIAVFIAFYSLSFAEEKSKPSTIEVVGKAKIMAMPDLATITFSVETNAAKAQKAVGENAKRTDRLISVLKGIAGKEAKIKTSAFALSPIYDKENRLRPKGYRVRNTVILETRSIDKLGTLIDKASEAGVSRIGSLTFSTSKEEQFRLEAAVRAVHQAKKIAADLAKAAGLEIKKIIKLSYGPREPVRPYRLEAMAAATRTPIEIGEIPVEERVNVVFEAN